MPRCTGLNNNAAGFTPTYTKASPFPDWKLHLSTYHSSFARPLAPWPGKTVI